MICDIRFHIKKNGEPGCNCFCTRPELIENYDKAVADTTQVWDCHHRMEKYFPQKTLIAIGWYYDCEPSELIFLTEEEHARVDSHCKRMSKKTGSKNSFYGRHHTKEQKEKWSKMRSEKNKGCHWWNNGTNEKFCKDCPKGWTKGRLEFSEECKKKMSQNSHWKK